MEGLKDRIIAVQETEAYKSVCQKLAKDSLDYSETECLKNIKQIYRDVKEQYPAFYASVSNRENIDIFLNKTIDFLEA